MPQDMRDAKIIVLYKNKGSRSDCNSYRKISLKAFARMVLPRIQKLAKRVYHESQCDLFYKSYHRHDFLCALVTREI